MALLDPPLGPLVPTHKLEWRHVLSASAARLNGNAECQ